MIGSPVRCMVCGKNTAVTCAAPYPCCECGVMCNESPRSTDGGTKLVTNESHQHQDVRPQHYSDGEGGKEHWDEAWEEYREAWFVLNITKYISRYRKKDGIRDLHKARTYLNKLIELEVMDAINKEKGGH